MSIDEERALRGRLDGVLEAITPSPAPVAATLRRGRSIRTRRRIGVAAGLAAAIGIALAAPGLVHQIVRQPPATPEHRWVVTVYPPGPRQTSGLIAWGTINGKRWEIVATNGGQCVQVNPPHGDYNCGGPQVLDPASPVETEAAGDGHVLGEYGVVQPDVASVVITLANGTNLTLHPYRLYRQRWIAFAVPADLAIAKATAYSRTAELAYAIPYENFFVTWLRPGTSGPSPATRVIASGAVRGAAWSLVVHVGPWGYCSTAGSTMSGCKPLYPRPGNSYAGSGGLFGDPTVNNGDWLVTGTASPSVGYVIGTLADGRTLRAQAVDVGGVRFWAWIVPQGQRLRRVVFYTASGRQAAVQSGATYNVGL